MVALEFDGSQQVGRVPAKVGHQDGEASAISSTFIHPIEFLPSCDPPFVKGDVVEHDAEKRVRERLDDGHIREDCLAEHRGRCQMPDLIRCLERRSL